MSASTSWASAAEADHAFHGPFSNTVGTTLATSTPGVINFDQAGLKAGLYDWYLTDPSAAIDATMKVSLIHLDANTAGPNLAAHTPAANGAPNLMRLFPASAWLSIYIPQEFPRLSICFLGVGATIWFVKRYPGA
jgi:hypothetical protein